MTRLEALREMGIFMRHHQSAFVALPRDEDGKPSNIEIRKLLAVDIELATALAALIAIMYLSVEQEARSEMSLIEGRVS